MRFFESTLGSMTGNVFLQQTSRRFLNTYIYKISWSLYNCIYYSASILCPGAFNVGEYFLKKNLFYLFD